MPNCVRFPGCCCRGNRCRPVAGGAIAFLIFLIVIFGSSISPVYVEKDFGGGAKLHNLLLV
jgi:hypothetical protein